MGDATAVGILDSISDFEILTVGDFVLDDEFTIGVYIDGINNDWSLQINTGAIIYNQ